MKYQRFVHDESVAGTKETILDGFIKDNPTLDHSRAVEFIIIADINW